MKIEASMINMTSKREYSLFSVKESYSVTASEDEAAAIYERLSSSEDVTQGLKDYEKENEKKKKEQSDLAALNQLQNMMKMNKLNKANQKPIEQEEEFEIKLLRKILESFRKYFNKHNKNKGNNIERINNRCDNNSFTNNIFASDYSMFQMSSNSSMSTSMTIGDIQGAGINTGVTKWVNVTATSEFISEKEQTMFKSVGLAKTTDGREIEFNISVEMSRAFCAEYSSLSKEEFIVTDPIVVNVDNKVSNISDKKFMFDLDSDGQEEEISFAGEGSGFLALDKNKDGIVNDGSELFGTKSGNGFKDLAEYDSDKNGWIDENDDVFSQLRIWSKDSEGNDRFLTLKESDVGAIYLGYADTEFTLHNLEDDSVNGIVRNTGIFLKESGGVGSVQHIDLAL